MKINIQSEVEMPEKMEKVPQGFGFSVIYMNSKKKYKIK